MQEITQDRDVVEIQQSTSTLEGKVNTLAVTDERSSKFATDLLSFIKKNFRSIETKRKFFVQPLNEHVKEINSFFKGMTEPLQGYEKAIKDKLLGWHHVCQAKEAARLKEEQAKIDATSKDLGLPPVKAVEKEVKNQTVGSMGKTFVQKRWTFDVVDKTQVPSEYLFVNSTAVNSAIRAGARMIPGLKIHQVDSIGSR